MSAPRAAGGGRCRTSIAHLVTLEAMVAGRHPSAARGRDPGAPPAALAAGASSPRYPGGGVKQ
ncbi:MAG: hypothetical protein ACRDSL_22925 [Pseudonocardiaceae bacterium]